MTDISVIILVGQEKLHIGRCLDKLAALDPRQVFVVTSQPDDGTESIAREKGATVVFHAWPGTQANQFNWALDNLPVEGAWVLRLDADEYLTDASVTWLKDAVGGQGTSSHVPTADALRDDCGAMGTSRPTRAPESGSQAIPEGVDALAFTLERKFCGGVIRHGTNGIKMVRMFRRGRGRYADTQMDERIVFSGAPMPTPVVFYDDNLNSMDWWRAKHRGYAKREAAQALAGTFPDPRKAAYYKLPPYLRALLYFGIRYVLKRGFLDGYAGWMWNFWQGLWYRWIVDREIGRMKRRLRVEG